MITNIYYLGIYNTHKYLFVSTGGVPTWTSLPPSPSFVVEGDNITLQWEYNIDGSFTQAQFSDFTDGGEGKAVAVKLSANGNTVVASAYHDRFLVNISDTQTLITILGAQKSDHGGYVLEVINSRLETINSRVVISVKCKYINKQESKIKHFG